MRVLVVDDDRAMVSTLGDVLLASGYEVELAHSGGEAVERAARTRPDCILMDIRMPDLDGVEAFRRIKRLSPASFVIFMTAYSSSSLVVEAQREGAVDVLPKPLDLERVLELIRKTAARTPVLVVDDDPAFCRSLADALTAHHFDVNLAASADQALELFERDPRQVVVADMKLDGKTGLDVLQLVKQRNEEAVVILITGFAHLVEEMRRGLSLSAAACFIKPLEVDELIRAIRQATVQQERSADGGP